MTEDAKIGAMVGFDLGAKGAVALRYRDGTMETRLLKLPKLGDRERAGWWYCEVAKILEMKPTAIAYEDPHFVGAMGHSHTWIRRQEGILLAMCDKDDVLCIEAPTPTVRAHAVRHGAPKPAKGKAKQAMRQGAANRGWACATASEDEIDAAWVLDWLCAQPLETVR